MLAGDSQKYAPDELPHVRLADILDFEAAVKTLARWIERKYDSEVSKRDMRVAIRIFADHVTDTDGVPEHVDQLSGGTPRSHNPNRTRRGFCTGTTTSSRCSPTRRTIATWPRSRCRGTSGRGRSSSATSASATSSTTNTG